MIFPFKRIQSRISNCVGFLVFFNLDHFLSFIFIPLTFLLITGQLFCSALGEIELKPKSPPSQENHYKARREKERALLASKHETRMRRASHVMH